MKKVLGLCGSLRADSYNLKLLRNFLAEAKNGGTETELHPALHLPLMNEDLEKQPLPAEILKFRAALEAAPIVAVASPEYNASLSPALKNAIDWGSRPPRNLWEGKIVVLLGASPGALGGVRGLIHLRAVLANLKSWIIPEQVQLPAADKAFDPEGKLQAEQTKKQITGALASLESFTKKML